MAGPRLPNPAFTPSQRPATVVDAFFVASGLSIIFGVTQVVNFSHGSFYMLGAFVAYSFTSVLPASGLNFWFRCRRCDDSRCNGRTSDRTCSS